MSQAGTAKVFKHTFETTTSKEKVLTRIRENTKTAKCSGCGTYGTYTWFSGSANFGGLPCAVLVAGFDSRYKFFFNVSEENGKTQIVVTSDHDYAGDFYRKVYDGVLKLLSGTGYVETNQESYLKRPENERALVAVITVAIIIIGLLWGFISH